MFVGRTDPNRLKTNTGYQIFLCHQWDHGRFHPHPSLSAVSPQSAGILSGSRSPNESPQTS